MEELIELLKLTEQELKYTVYNYLLSKKMSPIFEDGFVYAKGKIPILLVAHLDTVLAKPPQELSYDVSTDRLFSQSGGIGGDDRCGVYAIMKLLDTFKPHVLFTESEEIGGIGARKTVKKLPKPDVKYIIEFDRRGSNDCVFYDCGNLDFINYISSFGFNTAVGSFSDISILSSAWDIAAVNLSSGYYYEHTPHEYIKFKELLNNIERVKTMLNHHRHAKYFKFEEFQYYPQTDPFDSEDLFLSNCLFVNELFNSQLNHETADHKTRILKNDNHKNN